MTHAIYGKRRLFFFLYQPRVVIYFARLLQWIKYKYRKNQIWINCYISYCSFFNLINILSCYTCSMYMPIYVRESGCFFLDCEMYLVECLGKGLYTDSCDVNRLSFSMCYFYQHQCNKLVFICRCSMDCLSCMLYSIHDTILHFYFCLHELDMLAITYVIWSLCGVNI